MPPSASFKPHLLSTSTQLCLPQLFSVCISFQLLILYSLCHFRLLISRFMVPEASLRFDHVPLKVPSTDLKLFNFFFVSAQAIMFSYFLSRGASAFGPGTFAPVLSQPIKEGRVVYEDNSIYDILPIMMSFFLWRFEPVKLPC